jgi:carbamoyltransferase
VGRGDRINVIDETPKFHSVANFLYSAVTAHLGLRPWEHEYKVMGMAPYGQAEYVAPILRQMFAVRDTQFRNLTGRIGAPLGWHYARRLYHQRFDNICAACQLVFEELMVQWVRNAIAKTGIRKVCCAGGAFLNVKANKLIREMPEVESFYAYPASDDGGTPVGGAILGYLDLCQRKGVSPQLQPRRDMYLGVRFTEQECEAAAKASGLPYRRMDDPPRELAKMLADGQIIGRFAGGEEVGPRALGNRSILADARDLKVIRKLNFAIKQRDFWMPFAASVLEEDATKYIRNLTGSPYYMIEAFDTTPDAGQYLLAGMHPFDMTIRPQLVNELNPEYRDLIRAFRDLTGVGGLLNTSFNLHGSPIVGTPEIALDTLKKSDLDAVALESILVSKQR